MKVRERLAAFGARGTWIGVVIVLVLGGLLEGDSVPDPEGVVGVAHEVVVVSSDGRISCLEFEMIVRRAVEKFLFSGLVPR